MNIIENIDELKVDSLRTSYSYTGTIVEESLETKLFPIKQKLIKKALDEYKTISTCGVRCFQIYEEQLLFWFNFNETTKTISEDIEQFAYAF